MAKIDELSSILKGIGDTHRGDKTTRARQKSITARAAPVEHMAALRSTVTETMPVTKTKVKFHFEWINPEAIDVHPHIPRHQGLLTVHNVADILPSIRDQEQQEPGLLRPKGEGRFELIDGSRRFFCIKTLGDRLFYAKIGEIPDGDIEALFAVRDQKLPHSDYEKGRHYLSFIPDIYATKAAASKAFAEREQVSETTIFRRMQLAETPDYLVALLDSPNELSVRDVQWFYKHQAEFGPLIEETAKALLQQKMRAIGEGRAPDGKALLAELKLVSEKPKPAPRRKSVLRLSNKLGEEVLKVKVNQYNHTVFELVSATPEQLKTIQDTLYKVLQVKL